MWRATHFSGMMASMLHVDPGEDAFGAQLALARLEYVAGAWARATMLADNGTGLLYEPGRSYR